MKTFHSIAYNPAHGIFGEGDLYLPDSLPDRVSKEPVLLIHGGAWCAMDKYDVRGIADFLCRAEGHPVFNINYRLCGEKPWPACGDDCMDAALFLLDSDTAAFAEIRRDRIFVAGGSSGGHLAMMTGLRLPENRIAGIISISGVLSVFPDFRFNPERYRRLFGFVPEERDLARIEPAEYLKKSTPPMLITHEETDTVVPKKAADAFLTAALHAGCRIETFFYRKNETGDSHRIWIPGSAPHKLYPEIEAAAAAFLRKYSAPQPPPAPLSLRQ